VIWLLTFGLFGIGWLVDIFLIPEMKQTAEREFQSGPIDYNLAWIFFILLGVLGVHRFYQGKLFTGLAFFFTAGFVGFGLIYDLLTLNDQLSELNQRWLRKSQKAALSH
jgi:TM2 domain-containing membrane protein YozV